MTKITPGAGGIRPARLIAVVAVLGTAIVVTATGSSALSRGGSPGSIVGSSDPGALARVNQGPPPLTVSGTSPQGLAPGVTRQVTVTVRNSTDQHVRLKKVIVTVGNASAGCPAAGNLEVTNYHAHETGATPYVVWHKHPAHVPLTVSMIDTKTNQDACKGQAFPLTFSATGKKG